MVVADCRRISLVREDFIPPVPTLHFEVNRKPLLLELVELLDYFFIICLLSLLQLLLQFLDVG